MLETAELFLQHSKPRLESLSIGAPMRPFVKLLYTALFHHKMWQQKRIQQKTELTLDTCYH